MVTTDRQELRVRALRALGKLPPFSPILNRLIASLAEEDVSFARLAELIEKDTVLAGNVLRLVNSALYNRGATVSSVRHAVSILGINKLRNGVLGLSVTSLWNRVRTPKGWSMSRFNMHSVATALLSDLLSQAGPVDYAEGAFTAGLFHDLGRFLIAIGLPEQHQQIALLHPGHHFSQHECESEVLEFSHAEISADALIQWKLPEEICTAVRFHHNPELGPQPKSRISLSRVIHVADQYVNALGHTVVAADEQPVGESVIDRALIALERLELDQPIPPILENFAAEFEAMRVIF